MSSVITSCTVCGRPVDAVAGGFCNACAPSFASPPMPSVMEDKASFLDLFWAFGVWGISGGFLLILDAAFRVYMKITQGQMPEIQMNTAIAIVSLGLTMIFQLAGLVAAWMYLTRLGKRPFWRTMGWGWHPKFKLQHAVGLAVLMLGVAVLCEKLLPHHETDLEKILKLGLPVRLMMASLAVLTAPLIEEVVYRGVVYSTLEKLWGSVAGVVLVTVLFATVHVPQYWGSPAAITAILSLSLVLTLLRAWTGKLLPCFVTHLVYNGIQAVLLLAATGKPDENKAQPAITLLSQALGWIFSPWF